MKKILLVSGCSFTTANYKSAQHPEREFLWNKWPKILAEKLNMDCINLAQSGTGNEFIYSSIIDKIESMDKSSIGLVIPAWSQCRRRDYQMHFSRNNREVWRSEMFDTFGDIEYWIKKSFRIYYSFQIYCEYFKIPYKQIQMIELYKDNLREEYSKLKYYAYDEENIDWKKINEKRKKYNEYAKSLVYYKNFKNFVGKTTPTQSLQDILTDNRKNKQTLKWFNISSEDPHPSKYGHNLMAEYIHENL
jgi:hypothetical protein